MRSSKKSTAKKKSASKSKGGTKMTKAQLSASGKATMAEAKRIYAASGKKKKWQSCVGEAARKVHN
ncbi:MAG: hypothetical protein K9G46_07115 [Flavobacteriales bacterium]|nr:hypothetical protein [Flavobacteriales bacterium]